ncbi:MAG: hypothetical protein MPJ22_11880, partial [Pirellulales bacterium]|nr:hypothetical protein [Pirellulales bacterium]
MNDFEHIHPPVPDKQQFQIKVEEEKKKKTNILDDSAKKPSRSFGFSFISHAVLLLVLLCIGLKQPEVTDPVVIDVALGRSEEERPLERVGGGDFADYSNFDPGKLKETVLPDCSCAPGSTS